MAAAQYDFQLEQGVTYKKHLLYSDSLNQPIDLTGWSSRMQIRTRVTDVIPTVSITSDAATSDVNTLITMGGTAGTLDVYMSDIVTSGLNFKTAVYDLEIVAPNGDVTRLISGTITLSLEVTRP